MKQKLGSTKQSALGIGNAKKCSKRIRIFLVHLLGGSVHVKQFIQKATYSTKVIYFHKAI
uniref:Uncharacterized protein n=1 Tax=Arundo donax TaxID=35708 RepID=A0A0A9HIV9_ARUDO